jgi:hypothetical protein
MRPQRVRSVNDAGGTIEQRAEHGRDSLDGGSFLLGRHGHVIGRE